MRNKFLGLVALILSSLPTTSMDATHEKRTEKALCFYEEAVPNDSIPSRFLLPNASDDKDYTVCAKKADEKYGSLQWEDIQKCKLLEHTPSIPVDYVTEITALSYPDGREVITNASIMVDLHSNEGDTQSVEELISMVGPDGRLIYDEGAKVTYAHVHDHIKPAIDMMLQDQRYSTIESSRWFGYALYSQIFSLEQPFDDDLQRNCDHLVSLAATDHNGAFYNENTLKLVQQVVRDRSDSCFIVVETEEQLFGALGRGPLGVYFEMAHGRSDRGAQLGRESYANGRELEVFRFGVEDLEDLQNYAAGVTESTVTFLFTCKAALGEQHLAGTFYKATGSTVYASPSSFSASDIELSYQDHSFDASIIPDGSCDSTARF
tara:strand:+ start:4165 stop:5295 length:1131 start_codon:yes stop_codon:yes gene_type:complete